MPVEIERKFLVKAGMEPANVDGILLSQGYLFNQSGKSIRVRIAGHRAFLTIKGPDNYGSRDEFEYEIPYDDAHLLLENYCEGIIINKIRRIIRWENHLWEVDEFLKENKGLWLAEVELNRQDDPLPLPSWVDMEVTGNEKYLNSYLARFPFTTW
jgi:CYTH domain-containing protein